MPFSPWWEAKFPQNLAFRAEEMKQRLEHVLCMQECQAPFLASHAPTSITGHSPKEIGIPTATKIIIILHLLQSFKSLHQGKERYRTDSRVGRILALCVVNAGFVLEHCIPTKSDA